jgi:hypothetical protein
MNVDVNLTLAALFTAGGAVAGAAIIRQLIEVLKVAFPVIDQRLSGATMAFILSAVLYVLAWIAVGGRDADGIFLGVTSWIACAVAAIGINATVDHVQEIRTGGG